jgi:hydrogenase maturation protease
LHLAYELLSGHERAILIDAVQRGGTPGTLYVIEPDPRPSGGTPDAHRMDLQNVFAFVRTLGGEAPPIILVGCEPETADEGIGLSAVVAAAVEPAAKVVRRLVKEPPTSQKTEREAAWSAT